MLTALPQNMYEFSGKLLEYALTAKTRPQLPSFEAILQLLLVDVLPELERFHC